MRKTISRKIFPLFITLMTTTCLLFSGCSNYYSKTEVSLKHKGNDTSDIFETHGKTACWEVTSKDGNNKIYLMGTIHVGLKDTFPLRKEITDAYNSCDCLAVECDIDKSNEDMDAQIAFAQKCLLKDGTKIYDHIDKDTYKKAKKILLDNKMYNQIMDMYNPCMWYSILDNILLETTKYKSEYGVDINLITDAKENGKQVLEVESVEFQQDMLYNFSDETYNYMIKSNVDSKDDYEKELDNVYNFWKTGDIKTFIKQNDIENSSVSEKERKLTEEYNKVMLTDRNKGMADKAEEYLKGDKTVFFAVGFMHMIGDDGVVNQLIQKGYTVRLI